MIENNLLVYVYNERKKEKEWKSERKREKERKKERVSELRSERGMSEITVT